jgi:hypothetical protein
MRQHVSELLFPDVSKERNLQDLKGPIRILNNSLATWHHVPKDSNSQNAAVRSLNLAEFTVNLSV